MSIYGYKKQYTVQRGMGIADRYGHLTLLWPVLSVSPSFRQFACRRQSNLTKAIDKQFY